MNFPTKSLQNKNNNYKENSTQKPNLIPSIFVFFLFIIFFTIFIVSFSNSSKQNNQEEKQIFKTQKIKIKEAKKSIQQEIEDFLDSFLFHFIEKTQFTNDFQQNQISFFYLKNKLLPRFQQILLESKNQNNLEEIHKEFEQFLDSHKTIIFHDLNIIYQKLNQTNFINLKNQFEKKEKQLQEILQLIGNSNQKIQEWNNQFEINISSIKKKSENQMVDFFEKIDNIEKKINQISLNIQALKEDSSDIKKLESELIVYFEEKLDEYKNYISDNLIENVKDLSQKQIREQKQKLNDFLEKEDEVNQMVAKEIQNQFLFESEEKKEMIQKIIENQKNQMKYGTKINFALYQIGARILTEKSTQIFSHLQSNQILGDKSSISQNSNDFCIPNEESILTIKTSDTIKLESIAFKYSLKPQNNPFNSDGLEMGNSKNFSVVLFTQEPDVNLILNFEYEENGFFHQKFQFLQSNLNFQESVLEISGTSFPVNFVSFIFHQDFNSFLICLDQIFLFGEKIQN
ncbi:sad1/unc-84-like protein-related [Anaeramoeba ignava]|uniref:Sad1/unc-84-like protein-related n=1 Tax=Anaeramoeba ignava TaxID=1746090 RepID=A0A9Q0L9V0_ANAIG|nr:sad1/unc-84-like protein-related [Anaeramoeba ignava]